MFHSHTAGIEEDQHNDTPIEWLRLDGPPNARPDSLLHGPKGLAGSLALEASVYVIGPRESCVESELDERRMVSKQLIWYKCLG